MQTDGILGQEDAYSVARSVDGAVLGPYTEVEVQRLAELAARPYRSEPQALTLTERDDFWALLGRRALPDP